ncbi:MAG TPA: tetratricopeptide repeat protein [Candidatus Limnocylindrales bacterium]|nr:tetratricopeptide repeat protein [Candidatus Limnocylindrales bacterium]
MSAKRFGFLEAAMQRLTKGRGKAAPDKETDKYEAALKENPNNTEALNALGDIYAKQGLNDKAKEYYVRAGRLFAEDGFTLKAIAVYKKAQRTKPDSADTYIELANLYVQKGLIGDAKLNYMTAGELLRQAGAMKESLDVFRKAVDLDPENITLHLKLAEQYEKSRFVEEASGLYLDIAHKYIHQGMISEGAELYKKVISIQPENVDLQFELVYLYLNQNLLEEGIGLLEKIQEQYSHSIPILEKIAEAYSRIRKLDKAARIYQRLVELDPSNKVYRSRLGLPTPFDQSPQEEITDLTQIADLEPGSLNFGEEPPLLQFEPVEPASQTRGTPDQTLEWNPPTVKKESDDLSGVDLPEGVSLVSAAPEPPTSTPPPGETNSGYFDLAARLDTSLKISQEYEVQMTQNPSDSKIQIKVDAVNRVGGDNVGDIIKEFKKSVLDEVGEEDYETHYELGIAYKEMNLLDDAIEEFKLAALSPAKYMECSSMIGLCLAEKGEYDQAIAHLKEALEKSGFDPEQYLNIRYELARIYEEAGQPDQALKLYKEIYQVNPQFMDVAQRLTQLAS